MTKKTSVTASATFDQMPRPNQRRNSGASTTRGTAFSILMYGSRTRASNGVRASEKPSEMPIAAPTSRPRSDSSSVTARCPHSVPPAIHRPMRAAMSLGRLTKNGSSSFSATSACHAPRNATPTASCQQRTARPEGRALRSPVELPAPLEREGFSRASRFTALHHFFAEHGPDAAIEIDERRQRAQLHQIARPLERHVVLRDDVRGGAGGENDDPIGERDRFLEIVRDEDDRLLRR